MPKRAMQLYTSAELHTVKPRLPRRLFVMLAMLVAVPIAAWIAFQVMHHAGHAAVKSADASPSLGEKAVAGSVAQSSSSDDVPLTPEQWATRHIPRIDGLPWSAPIYDKLEVQGVPDILCVIFPSDARPDDCKCFTEQVTPMVVSFSQCREYALHGVYNPYRKVEPPPSAAPGASAPAFPQQSGARFAQRTEPDDAVSGAPSIGGIGRYDPSAFLPSSAQPDRDLSAAPGGK